MMEKYLGKITLAVPLLMLMVTAAVAVTPPSEEVWEKMRREGTLQQFADWAREKQYEQQLNVAAAKNRDRLAASTNIISHRIPVILVDFLNKPYTAGYAAATPADFDSLLFSEGKNPTGSMREFYTENSYGQYDLTGDVYGWYHSDYDYEEFGYSTATANVDELVRQAVDFYNAWVDFSQYDSDGDNIVDGIVIVHAGTGHEESNNGAEIHSFTGSISFPPLIVDGVYITNYTIQPEESDIAQDMNAIGVFCHEWGHALGLPDLYDVDYSSEGVGSWSLMGSGNYNGGSQSPSHLDAWCKKQLGWLTPTRLPNNLNAASIPAVEFNQVAYELAYHGEQFKTEYWLVENRQKIGFDTGLPAAGMLIWHIDDAVHSNSSEWHPNVFLEQADGKFDLQNNYNSGDGGDPWPRPGKIDFNEKTVPSSEPYIADFSEVGVWNISPSDSIMTADLEVFYTRPWITGKSVIFSDAVYGNDDGIIEAGEKIQVKISIQNEWAGAENVNVTISSDDSRLTFSTPTTNFGTVAGGATVNNNTTPFEFTVPPEFASHLDSFYFDVSANGGAYTTSFAAEKAIGRPQILIVDDDDGDPLNIQNYYATAVYEKRLPSLIWSVVNQGTPEPATLNNYHIVIWETGKNQEFILNPYDVDAIKAYLDQGGNLFLSGQGIATQLLRDDYGFMQNYLRAEKVDTTFAYIAAMNSEGGQVFGDISKPIVINFSADVHNQTIFDHIMPVNGGTGEWSFIRNTYPPSQPTDYSVVSYAGEYKLVFFAFGFESIYSLSTQATNRSTIMGAILNFFGQMPTDAADGSDMAVNLPDLFALKQNYPNPFNPVTRIDYTITGASNLPDRTLIEVFNLLGQRVTTLVDRTEGPGTYEVTWDGRDGRGRNVASGIYFYRLTRADQYKTMKMTLLK